MEEKINSDQEVGKVSSKKEKGILSKAFNLSYYIVTGLLAVVLIVSFVSKIATSISDKNKGSIGFSPTIVASGSMEPYMHVYSIVLVKGCTTEDVQVGDVIVYYSQLQNFDIIHRVIKIDNMKGTRVLTTKGDANMVEDPIQTTDENIVGKVVFIANWTAPFLQNAVINGSLNYARLILGSLVIVALLFIILTAFFVLVEILIILIKNIMEVNRHGIQQKE